MFAIFKNHNPFAVIALFILTILTRMVYVTDIAPPLVLEGQPIWQWMISSFWHSGTVFSYFMFFILVCNIFGQAILLNWISTRYALFPKYSYLPSYTFVLLTALLPEWNTWSVFTVLTWLLLIVLNNLLKLFLVNNAHIPIFNIGMYSACMAILLFPSSIILLLVLAGITILRPFRITEWLSLVLGYLLPYYLFVSICYLTDHLFLAGDLFSSDFEMLSGINHKAQLSGILLLLCIALSVYYASAFINRMIVETKKYWSVILLGAFVSLGIIIATLHNSYAGLSIALPFMALFFTFIFFEQYRKWIPQLFIYFLLISVLCIQWLVK